MQQEPENEGLIPDRRVALAVMVALLPFALAFALGGWLLTNKHDEDVRRCLLWTHSGCERLTIAAVQTDH